MNRSSWSILRSFSSHASHTGPSPLFATQFGGLVADHEAWGPLRHSEQEIPTPDRPPYERGMTVRNYRSYHVRHATWWILLGLLSASCSGGGSNTASTSTTAITAPKTTAFDVDLVVIYGGLSCTSESPIAGNGSRVTAADQNGITIGQGTFQLTTGAKSCAWSASIDVKGDPDFVTLESDKGKLATVSRSDVADGKVTLTALGGTIKVS